MGMFTGKTGIIMGVANNMSIAAAVAEFLKKEGAELGFSHLPDVPGRDNMERRVKRVTDVIGSKFVAPCDVAKDEDIETFFNRAKEVYGQIDFLVHSIAFAPTDDIRRSTVDVSREGFKLAMDISVYSLIATARAAAKLMPNGGSIAAMTYVGGQKVMPGYNLMGVCKAALEHTIRYLAYDLGPKNIRVNGISAGPIKTLASSAIGSFTKMLKLNAAACPLERNVTAEDVAKSSAFLLSDLSTATTGEIFHVDAGYNIVGSFTHVLEKIGVDTGKAEGAV